ncbi:hypothetical protein LTR37_000605 [Vermiconidia calcicola]|uniref:Uncharacterized protein n=1 Tax=Vermiconidia calcicola TaxID=1690605 RepID=A0ACC3NZJ8_9PEZI|nr:hypothetical protein LTR37_000605 [Vermiconidia calcicola]
MRPFPLISLASTAAALPSACDIGSEPLLGSIDTTSLYGITGPFASITPEILQTYISPLNEQLLRNSYVTGKGSDFYLGGERYTTSGANVYWLGLDENVIPREGSPSIGRSMLRILRKAEL